MLLEKSEWLSANDCLMCCFNDDFSENCIFQLLLHCLHVAGGPKVEAE